MRSPFNTPFPQTQDWNDVRYRASYVKYNILGHNGEDFGCPIGTPIVAPFAGRIIESQFDSGYGNYVKIEDGKQGSVLAHLSRLDVKVGDNVGEGQQIGLSGNTGNSTGPHLHWGYYRLPRNRSNGFLGYIDQSPDWTELKETVIDVQPLRDEITVLKNKIATAKVALG